MVAGGAGTKVCIDFESFDEKDEVNNDYRPLGLPATFFIAADGSIAKRHFGTVTADSLGEDVASLFG